jgi:DNA polymerase II large subunit
LAAHKKSIVIIDKLGFQGWDWLKNFKKKSEKKSGGFMDDVIAGDRSLLFLPPRGGFRLRYGRSRNTGLICGWYSPRDHELWLKGFSRWYTDAFELAREREASLCPWIASRNPSYCSKMDSVVGYRLKTFPEVKGKIQKILFLGDMLIDFGDFLYSNKALPTFRVCGGMVGKDLQNRHRNKIQAQLRKLPTLQSCLPESSRRLPA